MHRLRRDFVSSTRYPLEQKALNINKLITAPLLAVYSFPCVAVKNQPFAMNTHFGKVEEQQHCQNVTAKEDTKGTRTNTFVIGAPFLP